MTTAPTDHTDSVRQMRDRAGIPATANTTTTDAVIELGRLALMFGRRPVRGGEGE